MITLPHHPGPNNATPALIDYGVTLRPATGGPVQKVDRAGSRYRVEFSFPPMQSCDARIFISRLIEAKRIGELVMPFPLLGEDQGSPGSPVVDGAGQAGTSIKLRGLAPGHLFREGYWITIIDDNGQRYIYNVRENAPVGNDGKVTLRIEPPLRYPYLNGATVLAEKPEIQGFIDGGEWTWSIGAASIVGLSFVLEETR